MVSNKHLFLFLLFYFVIQLPNIFHPQIVSDEALYTWESYSIYKLRNPLFEESVGGTYLPIIPLLASPMNLFFKPLIAMRFFILLTSIATLFALFLLAIKIFDEYIASLAILLLAFSPFYFYFSTTAFLDIPVLLLIIATFYYVIPFSKGKDLVQSLALMAAAFAVKFSSVIYLLFVPPAILFGKLEKNRKIKYLLVTLVLLVVLWFIASNIPSQHFQSMLQLQLGAKQNLLDAFRIAGETFYMDSFHWIALPFLAAGFFYMIRSKKHSEKLLALCFISLSIIVIAKLTYRISASAIDDPRILLPVLPFMAIISAKGMDVLNHLSKKTHLKFAVVVMLCIVMLISPNVLLSDLKGQWFVDNQAVENYLSNIGGDKDLFLASNPWMMRLLISVAEPAADSENMSLMILPEREDFELFLWNCNRDIILIRSFDNNTEFMGGWLFGGGEEQLEQYLENAGFKFEEYIYANRLNKEGVRVFSGKVFAIYYFNCPVGS